MDAVRKLLDALIKEKGLSHKKVSEAIGKNHAYINQFITKNTPASLPIDVAVELGKFFKIDFTVFLSQADREALAAFDEMHEEQVKSGALDRMADQAREQREAEVTEEFEQWHGSQVVRINELDVRAAGGGGAVVDAEEVRDFWYIPTALIKYEIRSEPKNLRMVTVEGDSMSPILQTGDRIIVDVARRAPSPPGIFVLFDGIGLVVKRLEHIPNSEPPMLRISSENGAYSSYERTHEEVNVVGRVVWFARRL